MFSVAAGADDNTIRHINDLVKTVERDHAEIMDGMTLKSNTLQTALVQSQGVQEGESHTLHQHEVESHTL